MASMYRTSYPDYYGGSYGYNSGYNYSSFGEESIPKKRKLMATSSICIDNLRGSCKKGARCDQVHADHIPDLDEREVLAKSKFCHDFQNHGVCSRATCRFLHVTRQEEDEFLLTGTIAQSIFQRNYEKSSGGFEPSRRHSSFSSHDTYHPSRFDQYYPPYEEYSSHWPKQDTFYHTKDPPPPHKDTFSFSQPVTYGNYCIDNLKGTCNKGETCKLMHVTVIESKTDRDAIVKNVFCHDFLNRRCPRSYCKYLHATHDEQKEFLDSGYFGNMLCARNERKLFFCDICINYLRSHCQRGSGCQHRHVEKVESRDERVCLSRSIFCHDFQDGSCSRSFCKLFHTGKGDEEFFIETGCLPEHLRGTNGPSGGPSIEEIAETSCRDFLKGVCNRGVTCKYYHPSQEEARRIVLHHRNKRSGKGGGGGGGGTTANKTSFEDNHQSSREMNQDDGGFAQLRKENEDLKQRVQQLERLLADAYHCISIAAANDNQNPAMKDLMQSIASITQDGLLALQPNT